MDYSFHPLPSQMQRRPSKAIRMIIILPLCFTMLPAASILSVEAGARVIPFDPQSLDVDPLSGAETQRLITTVLPETTAPGLVRGRFRFAPSRSTGVFPATRKYIAKNRTGLVRAANGLMAGRYRLPCFEYSCAERTVFDNPTVPNGFEIMPFLLLGSSPLDGTGPVVGRLDPWPGAAPLGAAAQTEAPYVGTSPTEGHEYSAGTFPVTGRRLHRRQAVPREQQKNRPRGSISKKGGDSPPMTNA